MRINTQQRQVTVPFSDVFIASLVTPDHHFAQDASTTWRSCSYFHLYTGSHCLVPHTHYLWFKLPHLHVVWLGARLRNKVQPTTVMKLLWDSLCICAKGFIQVRATSFILVIYMQWAFSRRLLWRHNCPAAWPTLALNPPRPGILDNRVVSPNNMIPGSWYIVYIYGPCYMSKGCNLLKACEWDLAQEIHDWEAQYTNRKVPQGIVRYKAVMPQAEMPLPFKKK